GPVLLFNERLDLAFTLDDQVQSDGLHTSRGKATPHLVPQKRRGLVADQAIKDATRLLGIDQVGVDVTGVQESVLNRTLGDLIKGHSADDDSALLALLAVDAVPAKFFGQM